MKPKTTIFRPAFNSFETEEARYCESFCRRKTIEMAGLSSTEISFETYPDNFLMGEFLERLQSDSCIVITDPNIMMSPRAMEGLALCAGSDLSACGPVFNKSRFESQTAVLREPYLNLSSFLEKADDLWECRKDTFTCVDELDPGCVCYSRLVLESSSRSELDSSLKEYSRRAMSGKVHQGSLVHRFDDYFDATRSDLVELVPDEAMSVLDIGCSRGNYGRELKKLRPEVFVAGVEVSPMAAEVARKFYDLVFIGRLEECSFHEKFDLINCGDILEHLYDPWTSLTRLHGMLSREGHLVLSVPNVGHWTVVSDLLQGRFEYIPAGIQCVSHIRWFTEDSIIKALVEAGFIVDFLERQQLAPTRKGLEFIEAVTLHGLGNRHSLMTNEFIIRVKKK